MPFIHWEGDRAQQSVSKMIEDVKQESLKTGGDPKNNLWLAEKGPALSGRAERPAAERLKSAEADKIVLDAPEMEENYHELLRRYLYKRRPVHLRRTLDQYYYSHLADTNTRDGDQVVMRHLNDETKNLKLRADPIYQELLDARDNGYDQPTVWERVARKFSKGHPKKLKDVDSQLLKIEQAPYRDGNSPVLMVDQLWLWIVDESLFSIILEHIFSTDTWQNILSPAFHIASLIVTRKILI